MIILGKDKDTPLPDSGDSASFRFKPCKKTAVSFACKMNEPFQVHTLEGVMTGQKGDYLMMGVKGEFYPCAREVFNNSYEFIKGK